MPFIESFSINTDKERPFPFDIPAVKFAKQIKLDKRVTIFVGDNGSGKSTLLESIAYYLKIPLIGGHIDSSASFEAAKQLQPYIEIKMGIPGASLYEIQEDGMHPVEYKETDHYRITKTFLDNPEHYLRHF